MSTVLNYKSFFRENEEEPAKEYWGEKAAGCIFIAKDTGRILLAHRSDNVDFEPHTWGTWGGKIDGDETPAQAVGREVDEETGLDTPFKISPLYIYKDGSFIYHNYLVIVPFEFTPKLNWENDGSKWIEYGQWPHPLHFGMEALIQHSGTTIKKVIDLLGKKRDNMFESMDIPPQPPTMAQSADSFSTNFVAYIMKVENGSKVGRDKHGMWQIYKDPAGLHIGYGHKIENGEEKNFVNGLSDSEVKRLLVKDLQIAKSKIEPDIKHMFKIQVPLDQNQLEMLTDFTFNLGTLRGFPAFTKAVLNKDWKTAKKEYIRNYKDNKGNSHPMGRNADFYNMFLKQYDTPTKAEQVSEGTENFMLSKQGLVGDGIYGYGLKSSSSNLKYGYEPSRRTFYLYSIMTPSESDRNKGYAKALLNHFFQIIKQANGALDTGSFTTSGTAYIKHVVERFAVEYKVRLL